MTSILYSPLDRAADEIRLLKFRRYDPSSQIHLELRHVSLRSRPVYQAISYVWGTESPTHPISINNESVLVRQNLYSALCELPKQFTNLNLWCDALCINQEDIDERNHQVLRMGQIYGLAKRVFIWLGEEERDSGLAIGTLRLWGDIFTVLVSDSDVQSALRDPELTAKLFDPSAWTAIDYLTERPWWRRIWVIQEIALSESAVLVCGSDQCEWTSFCRAKLAWKLVSEPTYERFRSEDESVMLADKVIDAGDSILRLQQLSTSSQQAPDLMGLIRLTTKHLATDPRDMLYALLGMKDIVDIGDITVDVNYEAPVSQVYCNLVEAYVRDKHQLSILGGAGIGTSGPHPRLDLPSWVPDLRNFSMEDDCGLFAASSRTDAIATFSTDHRLLSAEGILCGTAQRVKPSNPDHLWENWRDVILPLDDSLHLAGIPQLQACFRTMICDSFRLATIDEDVRGSDDAETVCNLAAAFLYSIDRILPGTNDEKQTNAPIRRDDTDELTSLNDYVREFVYWQGTMPSSFSEEDILEPFLGSRASKHRLQWLPSTDRNRGQDSQLLFHNRIAHKLARRSLFATQDGYIGLGPLGTTQGDRLCILLGCELPILIRPRGQQYSLVGSCYVYGMMFGEVMEEVKAGKRHLQVIELI